MKYLALLLVFSRTFWCGPLDSNKVGTLTQEAVVGIAVDSPNIEFYKLDAPINQKNHQRQYVSLSLCSDPENSIESSPELFYYLGTTPDTNIQSAGWKKVSVEDTFKVINPNLTEIVSKKAYSDYYFGYRAILIDKEKELRVKSEDSVYLAIRIPIKAGASKGVKYQIGYSIFNFLDFQPYNFISQLLDTSDRAASVLVNNHTVDKFDSAVFYFSEFSSLRRFNTFCSIQSILRAAKKANNMTVNSENFKPNVRYVSPTEKSDTPENFYEAFLDNLKADTAYVAWLVIPTGDSSGTTFPPVYFRTKKNNPSCFLVRNLKDCDSVYHSVYLVGPNESTSKIPTNELSYRSWAAEKTKLLEATAVEKYSNFTKAVKQYDCKGHKYSPIRDCEDCKASYKAWICAITFPKCTDYSDPGPPDTKTTSLLINSDDGAPPAIKPCAFMCHFVMQDCPSLLNFRCPGTVNMDASSGTYFPTKRGIWSWAEYELLYRNSPFSSNSSPPIQPKPFCNAMLSPLRISNSEAVFRSNSLLLNFSSPLLFFSLLLSVWC